MLTGHLSRQNGHSNSNTDLDDLVSREINKYAIMNYEHMFYLNSRGLWCRSSKRGDFDRESRDTYELFFGLNDTRVKTWIYP